MLQSLLHILILQNYVIGQMTHDSETELPKDIYM